MKYVIYTGVFFMPDKNAAAQRALAFSKMIEKIGYKPVIIGFSKETVCGDIIKNEKEYRGIKIFESNYPSSTVEWLKEIVGVENIKRVIEYLGVDNCQCIIAMDYFSIALSRLHLYCRTKKIKIVHDTVDWFSKSDYTFPKNIIKDLDTLIRMKILNKKVKRMITISTLLKDIYEKDVEKVIRIPGVYYTSEKKSKKNFKDSHVRTISFVGSPGLKCEKEKIDWLIKAVNKSNLVNPKLKLLIVGIDKDTLIINRPDLIDEIESNENVLLLGRLDHSECIEVIKKSDFTTIIRENNLLSNAGFPTKLGESFAYGTPVLATPTSDICDFLIDDYGILTSDCSYESVEESIFEIANMDDTKIIHMNEVIRCNNPLSYEKYISFLREVVE